MTKSAVLSKCGQYRYQLTRVWGAGGSLVVFLMLNPSTADALDDDPTIRKCIGFATRLGFDGLRVVNLFAYRATDPKALHHVGWGIAEGGVDNDTAIINACCSAQTVIAAWGATDFRNGMVAYRAGKVQRLLAEAGVSLSCLGRANKGEPRHPLMLAYTTPLEPYGQSPAAGRVTDAGPAGDLPRAAEPDPPTVLNSTFDWWHVPGGQPT